MSPASRPDLLAKFSKACTISTFLASQQSQCDARKLSLSISDLAVFKHLLPDEVRFELEDTPTDTVFDGPPDQILIFGFADKRARGRKPEAIQQLIQNRIERFERALDQFICRRKTLDLIYDLSRSCIPPEVASVTSEIKSIENTEEPTGNCELKANTFKDQLDELCSDIENILARTVEPKREAQLAKCPTNILKYTGRSELWSHQCKAIEYLEADPSHHLVVSTATASGKSLIFHSLVKKMLDTSDGSALLIYPTKALAQDQLQSFMKMSEDVFIFDGDTPYSDREIAKSRARVLLVNPDILHTTILPRWKEWVRFLGNLKYVVMDELHYYGGIFGAHVACVLRRLRRLCFQLGAFDCQFIACSATLSDPTELMSTLTGLPEKNILALGPEDDGSPSGAKNYIFCTPNYLTPEDPTTGRMHPIHVVAPLLVRMVRNNLRVIAFCRFRRECELLLRAVYEIDESLTSSVRAYRGGYNADDRREIESLMFNGDLKGIIATSALEVGIDIGNLDAALICGFPHSVASFRQQVGRVGRRQRDSLVVYVADGSVIDQNYAADPERVLHEPILRAPIILHESIVRSHIQAAAYELAMEPDDFAFFPRCENLDAAMLVPLTVNDDENPDADSDSNDIDDSVNGSCENEKEHAECQQQTSQQSNMAVIANSVETQGNTEPIEHKDVAVTLAYPNQPSINIRKADDEEFDTAVIDVDTNRILEHVEFDRVMFTLYDGAIFVHQGKAYLVIYLDPDFKYAKVKRTNVKWITRQRDYTDVDPLVTQRSTSLVPGGLVSVSYGQIKVTKKVFGYFKFDQHNQIIDCVDVQIPENSTIKAGFYLNIPISILELLKSRRHHIPASIHAAEHALMSIMPLFISMAPGDVGTECKAPEKELAKKTLSLRRRPARLIFYERHGGKPGNGVSAVAYSRFMDLLECACDSMDKCACVQGCGACIGSGACVEHNAVLSKNGAKVILRSILMRNLDGIPAGPDPGLAEQPYETVVAIEAHTH